MRDTNADNQAVHSGEQIRAANKVKKGKHQQFTLSSFIKSNHQLSFHPRTFCRALSLQTDHC